MAQTPTTWIDLTDFLSWRGHFTGIQRVVYCYAVRFAADGAKFFVYDAANARHVEVPAGFLDQLQAAQAASAPAKLSGRQKFKQAVAKPYRALPKNAKAVIGPFAAASGEVAHAFLHKYVDSAAKKSAFRHHSPADFMAGDTVILIGAGWNEPASLELLCRIRGEKGIRLIQHINDILPVYQPQLFTDELPRLFTPYIEQAATNADVLTVISEATKRDLVIFCKERKIPLPKIAVVRLGEDVQVSAPKRPPELPLASDFILSVGTLEIRKNYTLLYQAAKLAQLEGKKFPDIVIAGRKGWLTEDLAHMIERDPFTQGKIIWLRNASDEELEWLYANCLFTVFPSLCEGWGLPMVESMQHGKLCLASNVSSMLEIGDGLVDYFSPYDARSCMDKILQYYGGAYEQMNARIKDEYEIYTWDDSYGSFKRAIK